MSSETSTWLNSRTLIGFTAKRGTAWHYRAEEQGEESNHYEGAIPVEHVKRRLLDWQPAEGDVSSTVWAEDHSDFAVYTDPSRKTIIRPAGTFGPDDQGEILGIFKQGYTVHEYYEWLVNNVANLLDDSLQIGSAGLLKGGAVAWVQIEVPETIDTPEGVSFRPHLMAATSLDGSLSSTYLRGVQVVVCDNTMSAALGERGALRLKIKHSRRSMGKINDVRAALGLVQQVADDFAAQISDLCSVEVSDQTWQRFLDIHTPLPKDESGAVKKGRGLTLAEGERDTLNRLWNHDLRVSPWKGTAFGVVQAVNTHVHHESNVRNASRADRNALRAVQGGVDTLDNQTMDELVLALA